MKRSNILLVFLLLCFVSSCIVKAPKYTTVEKVLALKLGLTKDEVSERLGIPPYNFKSLTDSGTVLLYKYRVTDRTTLPFLLKEANGKNVRGRYVNLLVYYDTKGYANKIESCNSCDLSIVEEKRVDVNKLITFLTITLPIVLVFFGIQSGLTQ
jgi:hypothetical protein